MFLDSGFQCRKRSDPGFFWRHTIITSFWKSINNSVNCKYGFVILKHLYLLSGGGVCNWRLVWACGETRNPTTRWRRENGNRMQAVPTPRHSTGRGTGQPINYTQPICYRYIHTGTDSLLQMAISNWTHCIGWEFNDSASVDNNR